MYNVIFHCFSRNSLCLCVIFCNSTVKCPVPGQGRWYAPRLVLWDSRQSSLNGIGIVMEHPVVFHSFYYATRGNGRIHLPCCSCCVWRYWWVIFIVFKSPVTHCEPFEKVLNKTDISLTHNQNWSWIFLGDKSHWIHNTVFFVGNNASNTLTNYDNIFWDL